MLNVIFIALYVGGATMLGGVIGYFIRYQNEKTDGAVFSFAAGVMLAAAFSELILPETEKNGSVLFYFCLLGLIAGGGAIHGMQGLLGIIQAKYPQSQFFLAVQCPGIQRALLFVIALAVHNLPEGIAAGVSLGSGDLARAFTVASGIALQNVPEGMIVLPPLIHAGLPRKKALTVSLMTGLIEMVGVFIGYFAASVSAKVLPVVLCLAGGTMLYIICTDVMADASRMAGKRLAGYCLLLGCAVMLIMKRYI